MKLFKYLRSVLCCIMILAILCTFMPPVQAGTNISSPAEAEITRILSLIENQNFSNSRNNTNAKSVKAIISYLIYDAEWAAINGNIFPYQNYETNATYTAYTKSTNGSKILGSIR